MTKYAMYKDRFVREDLKGREKEFSLCENCQLFKGDCEDQEDAEVMSVTGAIFVVWACDRFFPIGAKKVLQFQGEEFELK